LGGDLSLWCLSRPLAGPVQLAQNMTEPAPQTLPHPETARADDGMAAVWASLRDPALVQAIQHLEADRLGDAEGLIRRHLARQPEDALALTMMGDLADRLGIFDQAEGFLERSIARAPGFDDARLKLAQVLKAQGKTEAAITALDALLARDPDHLAGLKAKERIFAETGEYYRAIGVHERLLRLEPGTPGPLLRQGNALRTIGKADEAVLAFRKAIAIDPLCAEVWWSLSNMKSYRFSDEELARMEALVPEARAEADRTYFHFALGKGYEDKRDYARSFEHYAAANRSRLGLVPHSRDEFEQRIDEMIDFFSADFLAARKDAGAQARDPIFILGMPRAGSTLVEQILSSHSAIEGTAELPDMPALVRRLVSDRWQDVNARYPHVIRDLTPADFTALGERYLEDTRRHRKTDRPYFIDKLPMNWLQTGLIHLILPNATIIDARREPMACCFANFKQHFARGQTFAYSLTDVGHYYRNYVRMMEHFDTVLPGRVIRLQHEELLDDPERAIREMLDRMGLPFEEGCLRFHENKRAVRTPSAEQVRRPLNRDAVDLWRSYEPWLDPLKQALGPLTP
jgi:tetratricopeptide (TPR) repeat protein